MSDQSHTAASSADEPTSARERLEAARDRLEAAEADIESHGEKGVETAANAYRQATKLLDTYADKATGTGRENFAAYANLKANFVSLLENLPEDLEGRTAFEAAWDVLDKRRLAESDFERAREALSPAEQYVDLVTERTEAREALNEARKGAIIRRRELEDEIDDHEQLLELASADLEAPVERLREPIEAYNETLTEAFAEYRLEAPAKEVFSLIERSRLYPFVSFDQPPPDLREYITERTDGEYPIAKLLELSEYSRSKLDHYVEDADVLKRRVATQRTALERIDAEPLTLPWPPEEAGVLRRQIRERRPFAERIGGEECVTLLGQVRSLTRDPEYDRLQTAAEAIDQLTPDERRRLADGEVERDLEALRTERDELEAALEREDSA